MSVMNKLVVSDNQKVQNHIPILLHVW